MLRLPACSAPTLGPRRHGAVPSSARRRRCRRSSSRASRRTWPPSLSRPRLPSQHLRQHVLRFHSDVDGRAAVPVAQEPRALEAAGEKAEKVLLAIRARPGTRGKWGTPPQHEFAMCTNSANRFRSHRRTPRRNDPEKPTKSEVSHAMWSE